MNLEEPFLDKSKLPLLIVRWGQNKNAVLSRPPLSAARYMENEIT
jgi:hypothetical protein